MASINDILSRVSDLSRDIIGVKGSVSGFAKDVKGAITDLRQELNIIDISIMEVKSNQREIKALINALPNIIGSGTSTETDIEVERFPIGE